LSSGTLWLWLIFNLVVLGLLALDLGVFNRKAHVVTFREATIWSMIWITLALLFNGLILLWQGQELALQFLTGYLLEKSLSVDNIFVFVLIFSSLAVPAAYHHRVLFWGVLGALLMRAALIALGTTLVSLFDWIFYLFGAFLILAGIRLVRQREPEVHPGKNPLVRLAKRFIPLTEEYDGSRFFSRRNGQRVATPLLIALLLIESADLVFALDSIPAVFAITLDPFIVYTSNVFAILGLRSLYFLLAGSVRRFRYLTYGLAGILVFVGIKMLLAQVYHLPIMLSLGVIALLLAASITVSLLYEWKEKRQRERVHVP
jgi:tellurite resistance protein TerC